MPVPLVKEPIPMIEHGTKAGPATTNVEHPVIEEEPRLDDEVDKKSGE